MVSCCICMFVLCYFLLLTFVLLAKFHSQSSVRENSCCQRFFAGRHCCSFQFVIIQDRNFNAVGKHQLQPCELGPGKGWAGQWSAHTPPRQAGRVCFVWLLVVYYVCLLGAFLSFLLWGRGTKKTDRLMIKRHEVDLWSSSGKPWPGSQETLPSHHLICFSPLGV